MVERHALRSAAETFESEMARHGGDENRTYKVAGGQELLLSFYYPAGRQAGDRLPMLVFVHGGGWQSRKVFADQADWAGDYLGFLARRYADRGYLCAAIDYRLMRQGGQEPGWSMMDMVEDCMDAVEYLKDHAEALGADVERTAVLGESAGGHLAGVLATQSSFFQTAVLVNPITDFFDERWSAYLPTADSHPALHGLSEKEIADLFSPARQVKAGTCPTLLMHGAADSVVNPKHAQLFYDAMNENGNEAELHWIEDTDHAFLLADYMREQGKSPDAASIAVGVIDRWLETHLKG